MNDADLERLVADLPWAEPGRGLDARVRATLRTATARARLATAVAVGSLIAASLALAWVTTARHGGVVVRPHAPLAGDGTAGGGPVPAGGDAAPRGGPVPLPVAPRSFARSGGFGVRGPGAIAGWAAVPAGRLPAEAAAMFERVSPLLEPVNGMAGLVFTALAGVTPPRQPERAAPRAGAGILDWLDPRGLPRPGQVGRAG